MMETGQWSSSTEGGGVGRPALGAEHNNFMFIDVRAALSVCVLMVHTNTQILLTGQRKEPLLRQYRSKCVALYMLHWNIMLRIMFVLYLSQSVVSKSDEQWLCCVPLMSENINDWQCVMKTKQHCKSNYKSPHFLFFCIWLFLSTIWMDPVYASYKNWREWKCCNRLILVWLDKERILKSLRCR